MSQRLYYKQVHLHPDANESVFAADADLILDVDGTVVKDRQGIWLDLADQAWRYRELSA